MRAITVEEAMEIDKMISRNDRRVILAWTDSKTGEMHSGEAVGVEVAIRMKDGQLAKAGVDYFGTAVTFAS